MDEGVPDLRARYGEVFRYVRRRTANDGDAEEITQSVFAQAARRLGANATAAPPPLAWLYTVARRRMIDEARRRASRGVALPLHEESAEARERRYGDEVAAALRKAVATLPPAQRQVVVLRLVEGRPFSEIAERLGTTEAACKMRFLRGLASVRQTFEQEGIEP